MSGGRFGITVRLTWAMVATSQVLGGLFGYFAVFPLFESWAAPAVFLGGWVASTLWLLVKSSPVDAIGSGFHALAVVVFITPFKQYLPMLTGGSDVGGAAGARMIVEGAQGLLVWVTVCTAAALALVVVGRYCNRLCDRVDRERLRAGYRQYEM